ncbi:hypothetical protein EJ04DRAFT_609883 [Polyplosphaeria fusca]|uniref:Glycosyltransferase family 34 protein n=1 Tax=Polyplosphaeria fusca TaxID=682080 RepID=A0A9P4QVV0_9PLEO|nr:hypothetical protein EJ04DRAFT_609883 [Polyplosphaeria fusca]
MFSPPAWLQSPKSNRLVLVIKVTIAFSIVLLVTQLLLGDHDIPHHISKFTIPQPQKLPNFIAHGDSQCLPPVNQTLLTYSVNVHSECRKNAPFATGRARIATVTAHFGESREHYQHAFETHLLHSLIHGTELHVMCDKVVDDLWNKPAFILSLLLKEMELPPEKRLEWIFWVDRDTIIMDQCRPTSSFLPPDWHTRVADKSQKGPPLDVNLIVTKDHNGLNNGVFLLRVGNWALDMFTDILAFRDYKPDVELIFTEQSAMENVMDEPKFKYQTQVVPQHWFNAFPAGGPDEYESRKSDKDYEGMEDNRMRKGDFLLHFAGDGNKGESISQWRDFVSRIPHPWNSPETIRRDSTESIAKWWGELGF